MKSTQTGLCIDFQHPAVLLLRGVGQLAISSPEMGIIGLVESIELFFRSCNNLLERLHHSYFYYLMTNSNEFISILTFFVPVYMQIAATALKVRKNSSLYKQKGPPNATFTRQAMHCFNSASSIVFSFC